MTGWIFHCFGWQSEILTLTWARYEREGGGVQEQDAMGNASRVVLYVDAQLAMSKATYVCGLEVVT